MPSTGAPLKVSNGSSSGLFSPVLGMRVALVVAYHVDRSRLLTAGTTLRAASNAPVLPADVPDLESEWPGGVTAHGSAYASSTSFDGATVSEWMFELVRRNEFPEVRSRFQSFFTAESLADARALRHFMGDLNLPIVRVRGELTHRGNMNLIRLFVPERGAPL